MSEDNILRTYGDVSRKDDVVLNAVEILTAKETSLLNMLPKSVAYDTVHTYLTDTLATPGSAAVSEAGDYTNDTLTTPSRLTNIVEIVAKSFRVSRTQREVEHYHGRDELSRQVEKKMQEWANSAEFDILRSTLTSGVSGGTPKMNGVINLISTHASNCVTAHNSGTAFHTSILDGLVKLNYDNSNGELATDLFMGSFLRKKMDEATAKSQIVVNGSQTEIVRTVSTYATAFSTLRVHTHRYMNVSGTDATGRILAIRPDKFALAYLTKPYIDTELSRAGDYDQRAIVGKLTVEARNPATAFFASGFDID
jgi:hypothetical protein